MIANETILKDVRAALEREPRVNLHRNPIQIDLSDGSLILEGTVDSLAAKKLALDLARSTSQITVKDRLRLLPAEPREDGAIRDAFTQSLLQEPTLLNCGIRVWIKGEPEILRTGQANGSGEMDVSVEDGIITLAGNVLSLSHKRMTGALAWWSPGCRDVVNELVVTPPEVDNDDEISDAVRLVMEKDHLLPEGQIRTQVKDGAVTLQGLVFRESEKTRAEWDAWCVLGVHDVVNQIEVRK